MTGHVASRLRGAIVAAAIAVAGCSDSRTDVAACYVEALKAYPGESLHGSPKVEGFLDACMRSKGYRMNLAPKQCVGGWHSDLYEDANCYERRPLFSN